MNPIWQRLLSLESRDVVSDWFFQLHKNDLNSRRSKEITASARQAREFFRSSFAASQTVRPLLTFYGVASLSRALALLFRKNGGEEGLTKGHGLETVSWSKSLSGELSVALQSVGDLRIRTCRGLLADLIGETNNRIALHVNSSAVDWRLDYPIPESGREISLLEILDRLPDIQSQHGHLKRPQRYSSVAEMTYSSEAGASIKVQAKQFEVFSEKFSQMGYATKSSGPVAVLSIDAQGFLKNQPQFIHSYVQKTFGSIPNLHLTEDFISGQKFSQIAVTYILSYFLGMLARYYPTQWSSLSTGEKGDSLWPSINAASNYVEATFPELVLELIEDALKISENVAST